ncbi:MAG: histidinol-phosphate transaminase [Oceanococcus sp.]
MSVPNFSALANAGVVGLRAYEPGKPVEELERELGISDIIKLASNENPLGPSPAVEAVLQDAGDIARYPDGSGFRLKRLLGDSLHIEPAQITLGNGSNDVLELLARTFLRPGSNAVCSAHAFAVYPLVTLAVGAELRQVPALPANHPQAYGHDLSRFAEFVDDNTRLIFIANPNNPTGTWVDPAAIEQLLQQLPADVIVVLDEAYCEYQDESQRPDALELLARYPNLVVTRTFSKVFGLAALRIGYGISHPELADYLNRIRQPFNNNALALAAAEVAWQDQAHVAASVAINAEGMALYESHLPDLGLSILPSQANFVCVDFKRPTKTLFDALLRQGVIVRPLDGYAMPQHLRITIGTPEENQRCLQALKFVLQA